MGFEVKPKANRLPAKRLNRATPYEDTTKNEFRSMVLDRFSSLERKINTMKGLFREVLFDMERDGMDVVEVNAYIETEEQVDQIRENLINLTQDVIINTEANMPSIDVVNALVSFGVNRGPLFVARLIQKSQAMTQDLINIKALLKEITSINK